MCVCVCVCVCLRTRVFILFVWILSHINHCRLYNDKSCSYIKYIGLVKVFYRRYF